MGYGSNVEPEAMSEQLACKKILFENGADLSLTYGLFDTHNALLTAIGTATLGNGQIPSR